MDEESAPGSLSLSSDEWQEIAQRIVQQTMDLWVRPELERRRERGVLPDRFALWGAQVILDPDATAAVVRLNDEIGGVFTAKARGVVPKVRETDVTVEPEGFQLTDEDVNAGHVTLLLHKGRWLVSFDFRRNAGRIAQTIGAAREFLEAAATELSNGRLRAFAELLFAATELTAKGELLENSGRDLLDSHRHEFIASRYNLWGKLGNTEGRYVSLLNRLSDLRRSARYLRGEFQLSVDAAQAMLETAREALANLEATAPRRFPSAKIRQAQRNASSQAESPPG